MFHNQISSIKISLPEPGCPGDLRKFESPAFPLCKVRLGVGVTQGQRRLFKRVVNGYNDKEIQDTIDDMYQWILEEVGLGELHF